MRTGLPPYTSPLGKLWHFGFRGYCLLVLFFLILPLVVIIPLSFNASPYFTFTHEMVSLDPAGYSTRWYKNFFTDPNWVNAVKNSFIIAPISTVIAVVLGTLAALGLTKPYMPFRKLISALLVLPMVAPLIITAAALFFFLSTFHLTHTYIGIILAHSLLGIPFVVITVTATLAGFDDQLPRAAQSLGASPFQSFFKVTLPLTLPGIIAGGLFAFMTSFDEIVVVIFLAGAKQRTVPMQMWLNLRDTINPTILAVATLIVSLSVVMLLFLEFLRRRNQKMRGLTETN